MFVSSALPDHVLKVVVKETPARRNAQLRADAIESSTQLPFQIGAIDPSLFPHAAWARLMAKTWRKQSRALTGVLDPFGWIPLRRAISEHLAEWRGIDCNEQQVVVTSGTADAVDTIARCAFRPGDSVFVEEPGYGAIRFALSKLGVSVKPVAVDAEGMDIGDQLERAKERGAFLTPSRQFPLGTTLSLPRRLKLLDWVARTHGYVVEDDFDSEYRYRGTPLPAMMSVDRQDRVIYVGSFSKILSPSLRLGFVVLPRHLIDEVRAYLPKRGLMAGVTAQPALAEFIQSGDLAQHIRRTRRLYARRQQALIAASAELDGLLTVTPADAGMHLVADLTPRLRRRMTDATAARRAKRAGIVASPLSNYFAGQPRRSALLLGFAGFDEATLGRAARCLADALKSVDPKV
jgi:GntR family transcriptional regulator/MocR family aminotransferase